MAAEIPALRVSRDSAFVSFSGSWFLVLVTSCSSAKSWRRGEAGIATMACTMRNIIMALACCLLCWMISHERLSLMAVTLLV